MKCTIFSKLLLVLFMMPSLVPLFFSMVCCKVANYLKYTNISMDSEGLKKPLIQSITLQDAPDGFQHMNETENQSSDP